MGNSGRLFFYLLTALAALCCVSTPALAQRSERGEPGVAVRGTAVSFEKFARQEELAPQTAAPVEPAVIHPPKELPEGESGDPELIVPEGPGANGANEVTGPLASSPAAASSFIGSDMTFSIPPDTNGAVGPDHLMVSVNGRVRIQRRDGSIVSTTSSLTAFFGNFGSPNSRGLTINKSVFDPRIFYDHMAGRWIIVAVADSSLASSSVVVAVSQTSDPTGAWNFYQADADAANATWADYPSVGFNKDWIVVQTNMYSFNPSDPNAASTFTASNVWVFNKANLYAGAAGNFTKFNRTNIGGTQAPAVTFDSSLPVVYMVRTIGGTFGLLQIFTISGPVGAEVMTDSFQPSAGSGNNWTSGPSDDFAPQLDTTRKVQVNDTRMHSAVYRDGSLWCAHTIFLPAFGGVNRAAVQWWEINPTNGTVIQRGRVDDPTGANFYAFPSIAVNKNRDVLLGYSRFSATQYISANYSFRAATDPASALRDDTVLKAGEGAYDKVSGGTRNRWGDYSSTMVDPTNDTDLWTLQEYAAAPIPTGGAESGRWAVWWGKLALAPTPPVLPSVRLNISGSPSVSETDGKIQISVTRTGGDPNLTAQVDYATSDGTASERTDYLSAAGTLTFSPGETSKTVTVFLVDDAFAEGGETFSLNLSNPRNCTLDAPTGVSVQINSEDAAGSPNPVKEATFNASFFVKQHYLDFFNREADSDGLNFWTGQLTSCGTNASCLDARKQNVSAAFFLSTEFQETGYLVYRAYAAAFGRTRIQSHAPLTLREFLPDTQQIGRGVIVNAPGWEQQIEANKVAYFNEFVSRDSFTAAYPLTISPSQFVDTLNANAGGVLSQAERDDLVNRLGASQLSRAQVLRAVAEDADLKTLEKNRAFVLMQYFGYLRRNPNDAPELNLDFGGYDFWLGKLNDHAGNFVSAQMVRSFLVSGEYEGRFGP